MRIVCLFVLVALIQPNCLSQFTRVGSDTIETYQQNSSSYSSYEPGIRSIQISDGESIILTQTGKLSRIDRRGNLVWSRNPVGRGTPIIFLDRDSTVVITGRDRLLNYSLDGSLISEKQLSLGYEYSRIRAAMANPSGGYYLALSAGFRGRSRDQKSVLLSLDENGKVLWRRPLAKRTRFDHFLPPKNIVHSEDGLYVLSSTRFSSGTSIFKVSSKGRLLNSFHSDDFHTSSILVRDKALYALCNVGFLYTSKIRVLRFDADLNIIRQLDHELPINAQYRKEYLFRDPDTNKIKMDAYYRPGSSYVANDFIITHQGEIVIVGNSNKRPWLMCLNEEGVEKWSFTRDNSVDDHSRHEHYQEFWNLRINKDTAYIYSINKIKYLFQHKVEITFLEERFMLESN